MLINKVNNQNATTFKANKFVFDEPLMSKKIVNAKNEIVSGLSEIFGGDNFIKIVPESIIISKGYISVPDSTMLLPNYDIKPTGNVLVSARKQMKNLTDVIKTFLNYDKNEPVIIKDPTPQSIREAIISKLK